MGRKGRILVLDDQEAWRDELVEILQNEEYVAEAAPSVAKAVELLGENLYHVLVLDIRMEEGDLSNQEGIDLLRELRKQGLTGAVKVIVLSAHGTTKQAREAFKEFEVVDFLSKDAPFNKSEFLAAVRKAFETINLELNILYQQRDWVTQAVLNLKIQRRPDESDLNFSERMAEELEDLLCRLFYRAKDILVHPLTPGYSGTSVLRVRPFYSRGGSGHEVVVKFGNVVSIAAEYDNFKEYVEPFLGGGRNTTAIDFRRTPYLGGLIYSLLGSNNDQLVDFGDFYWQSDLSGIKKALEHLFRDTCGGWYANSGQQEPLDLANDYQKLLQYGPTQLEQLIFTQLSVEGGQKLRFKRLRNKRAFTNPIQAMTSQPHIYPTYKCITHGDFNQRNLLVDGSHNVWMIDFQATGYSHFLRDIAMLDTVVRFQLLRTGEATLKERLQMEEALCNVERYSEVEQIENTFSTDKPALAKAYAIVVYLRTLASKLMYQNPNNDISEYYVALFFQALNTLRFSSLSPLQREHALLSASLLADRQK